MMFLDLDKDDCVKHVHTSTYSEQFWREQRSMSRLAQIALGLALGAVLFLAVVL